MTPTHQESREWHQAIATRAKQLGQQRAAKAKTHRAQQNKQPRQREYQQATAEIKELLGPEPWSRAWAKANGQQGTPTIKQVWKRCGKPNCAKCPHGPYFYEQWREGNKVRQKYIGKRAPGYHAGTATKTT